MAKPSRDFHRVALLSPADMCMVHLDAAYYPGPNEDVTPIRAAFWHLQQEGHLNWNIRVFEGIKHLAALIADWTPDILVTHWHGEYRRSVRQSLPYEIANRLRQQRGDFRESDGPFIVGQISEDDPRFSPRLYGVYDMVIQRPRSFQNFPKNIATGIYNSVHPDAPLSFDMDFRVYPLWSLLK